MVKAPDPSTAHCHLYSRFMLHLVAINRPVLLEMVATYVAGTDADHEPIIVLTGRLLDSDLAGQ